MQPGDNFWNQLTHFIFEGEVLINNITEPAGLSLSHMPVTLSTNYTKQGTVWGPLELQDLVKVSTTELLKLAQKRLL